MSCLEGKKCCNGNWKQGDVKAFYDLPNTTTACSVGTDPEEEVYYEIKDYLFEGSCKVRAKGEEAYEFLKKSKGGTITCQNVFTNWKNNEQMVEFWMTDHSGESICKGCGSD